MVAQGTKQSLILQGEGGNDQFTDGLIPDGRERPTVKELDLPRTDADG
jgi:hypothetical protein